MKNILSNTKMLAALLMAGAAFTACSNDDNIIDEQPNGARTYKMTVDATIGEKAQTRALYFDGSALKANWASTDQVSVFPAAWSRTAYGTLTAAESATASTTLTGDLTTLPAAGNHLNLLFPRATWDYTGQTGSLLNGDNAIQKKFDYAVADVEVNSVTGNEIATTTANFQNQQAIVKFTLQDNGGNAINATSLNVSASSNKLVKNKSYRGAGTKTYYYGNGCYTVDGGSGGFNEDEEHGNLVDNKLDNKWCQNKPDGGWYIEFHTASPIKVDGYMLRTGGDTGDNTHEARNPKDWVLKGKKDSGDGWITIDTKAENFDLPHASNAEVDFDMDTPGEYQYFRLEISNNRGNGGIMQLSEMRLFSYEYYEMGTTYGDLTVTPASATSEIFVALRNENGSADTYTVSANVGGKKYAFSKSGVNFQNGKYYEITVKMTEKTASTVEWIFTEMSEEEHPDLNMGYTYKDVTLSGNGNLNFENGHLETSSEGLTFTAPSNKHFKSIVITATYADIRGTGWTKGGEYGNWTSTWTGDASTVTIDAPSFGEDVTSIVFTLE